MDDSELQEQSPAEKNDSGASPLSSEGISSMQGGTLHEEPDTHSFSVAEVKSDFDYKYRKESVEAEKLKQVAVAGLAGTVILGSAFSLFSQADFEKEHIALHPNDEQEIIVERPTVAQDLDEPQFVLNDQIQYQLQDVSDGVEHNENSTASQLHNEDDSNLEASGRSVPVKSQRALLYNGKSTQFGCVPTSVSMITDYWNQQNPNNKTWTSQKFLDLNIKQGEYNDGTGMSASNIHDELEKLGYSANDQTNASFDDLQSAVESGPVVALVKLGMKESGYNHAVVVTNIGEDGTIFVNDPWTGKSNQYNKETFINSWGASFGGGAPTRNFVTIQPAEL